ncbi:phosphate/phosphite/phosphonate ABC transporter substrate-binding protein [candidate division KSB1 bacterium]|nr:phosphate/phosphite/phosphonate ABC transporter substrate-binding protein [candidate division KSB1 bacterium]
MKYFQYYIAFALLLIFLLITVFVYRSITDITVEPDNLRSADGRIYDLQDKETVYVGVISRFSPNLIYEGYQPIMNYLSQVTPYNFVLKLSNSYEKTILQLTEGDVQAAFLGTYIYLKARKDNPIRCILKPLNNNFEPYFRSVIVTRSDSPFHTISDLKEKKLALPSPLSFSGNWLPRYEFKKYGITINDLDSVHYFDHHHTVIYQVLRGNFDVGVVKDRVAYEFINKGIRFLASSEPIPGSPIVVKSDLDPAIVEAMQNALLQIDVRDPVYKEMLMNWDPEFAYGFTVARDEDYDHITSIIESLEDEL